MTATTQDLVCNKCGIGKTSQDFYQRSSGSLYRQCKTCHDLATTSWAKQNPDKMREIQKSYKKRNPEHYANHHLIKKYGITLEDKKTMFSNQGGVCDVCNHVFIDLSDAHVDHNHTTKKVRGLLCHQCNVALGLLKEDKIRIDGLRYYLAKHGEISGDFSKFSAYLKEREDTELLEVKEGYATYKILGKECLIRDIYVIPEYRRRHAASKIADKICEIAKSKGCSILTGTVCPQANNATTSLNVLIGYGMRLHSSTPSLIYFIKELS